jgi:hypothetical protein
VNAGDYFRDEAGEAFLNLVTPTIPTNLYAAAFTDSVTFDGVGTEVADPASNGINYARKILPASAWTNSGNGIYSLTNPLVFNQALGGDWGTIVSVAFVTVATGSITGKVICFGDLDFAVPIPEFDVLRLGSNLDWVVGIL